MAGLFVNSSSIGRILQKIVSEYDKECKKENHQKNCSDIIYIWLRNSKRNLGKSKVIIFKRARKFHISVRSSLDKIKRGSDIV